MVIYVEGPDNVGKSTQINNIWKAMAENHDGFPYWVHYASYGIKDQHRSYNYSMAAYHAMFRSVDALIRTHHHPIFDRSHIGEWVYGKIYRDYDAYDIWGIEVDISQKFKETWAMSYLIVFIDDPKNLIDRDDGQSFSTDLKDKTFEVERFIDAYERSIIPHKKLINIAGKCPTEVWIEVKEFLGL